MPAGKTGVGTRKSQEGLYRWPRLNLQALQCPHLHHGRPGSASLESPRPGGRGSQWSSVDPGPWLGSGVEQQTLRHQEGLGSLSLLLLMTVGSSVLGPKSPGFAHRKHVGPLHTANHMFVCQLSDPGPSLSTESHSRSWRDELCPKAWPGYRFLCRMIVLE